MNLKKIVSAVAAAAIAVSMTAINAFAATVTMDSDYGGDWSQSSYIPKSEFEAIGGDVKVVLTVEPRNLLAKQFVVKPMNTDVDWEAVTSEFTSDTAVAKPDGFMFVQETQTTLEFVVPESFIKDKMGDSGLSFQVMCVTIKSAELSAGSAQGAIRILEDKYSTDYCFGKSYEELTGAAPAAEAAAPAVADAAPAADTTTASAATGNTAASAVVAVMVVAGAAALISKKRK